MNIKVGVIGAGTMGSGIAQVAANSGCYVKLYDKNTDALQLAREKLETILKGLVQKGKIENGQKTSIQNNISLHYNLSDLSDSDLVIEAIVEDLTIKKTVLSELESHLSENCIIATNTSSLSITSIASALQNPERCIGTHFFNPAPVMKLVEIIPSIQTSIKVFERTKTIIVEWEKEVVKVKDTPGFIVNRVARPFYGEALRIYEEGIADFESIDIALKKLGGFKMGPFELMDFIGNDVNYAVTESVFKAFYFNPRYKPSFTQQRLCEAGHLGRKSGRGFYNYHGSNRKVSSIENAPVRNEKQLKSIFNRMLIMLINEAADALFLNIAEAKDIDNAMTKGVNYPKGLLAWADEKGMAWCVEKMDALFSEYREERYRCSPILRKMNRENKSFFK